MRSRTVARLDAVARALGTVRHPDDDEELRTRLLAFAPDCSEARVLIESMRMPPRLADFYRVIATAEAAP